MAATVGYCDACGSHKRVALLALDAETVPAQAIRNLRLCAGCCRGLLFAARTVRK